MTPQTEAARAAGIPATAPQLARLRHMAGELDRTQAVQAIDYMAGLLRAAAWGAAVSPISDEEVALEMAGYHEWHTAEAEAAARNAYVDAEMRRRTADRAARFAAAGNYRAAERAAADTGDFVAAAAYAAAADYQARYVAGGES